MMTDPTSFLAWAFEMGAPDVNPDYLAPILGDATAALLAAAPVGPRRTGAAYGQSRPQDQPPR